MESPAEQRFWEVMLWLSAIAQVVCILWMLTLWIWQPKAWLFSAWIALCIAGGVYEASKEGP